MSGSDALFCSLDSAAIAEFIATAKNSVCYASPGIRLSVADSVINVAGRLGPELVTVCLDFDESVIRMGYGDLEAVNKLRSAGISVLSAAGLRTALIIVDKKGFIFTPTALYLEAEQDVSSCSNAIRMSDAQVAEALARLSPVAKVIAIAQAKTPEEKKRIEKLPVDVGSKPVTDTQFSKVENSLKEAPPVSFDLARQVRVFEAYLQYVEISLTGAAIQRNRLSIPNSIQKLGGSKELEGRLKTTFNLIEKDSAISSKPLEDKLNLIRKDLTRPRGKKDRLVLKSARPLLDNRLNEFRKELKQHQVTVKAELQNYLTKSREQIVEYYLQNVIKNPPDALLGQLLGPITDNHAKSWLNDQLDNVFPTAESLIKDMKLDVDYKDITFETLNREDFLQSVKLAYGNIDWDKLYKEFKAAAEKSASSD